MTDKKSVREALTEIGGKLDKLIENHNTYCLKVEKHELELYGETASKDKIGLVRIIDGIKNSIDNFRNKYAAIVGVVSMVGAAIITAVINFIFRHRSG